MGLMTQLRRVPTLVARYFRGLLRLFFKTIFEPAARYPADPRAVFVLALSVFSGLTSLLIDSGPATLESLLPSWAVTSWGALLMSGSAITLVGMARQTVNGIIAEQIGSVMVGVTTVFYSVVALAIVGIGALQSIGIILAWGLSCFLRWVQLQALLRHEYERRVEDQIQAVVKQSIRDGEDERSS
jgi:hypothetical protein